MGFFCGFCESFAASALKIPCSAARLESRPSGESFAPRGAAEGAATLRHPGLTSAPSAGRHLAGERRLPQCSRPPKEQAPAKGESLR